MAPRNPVLVRRARMTPSIRGLAEVHAIWTVGP